MWFIVREREETKTPKRLCPRNHHDEGNARSMHSKRYEVHEHRQHKEEAKTHYERDKEQEGHLECSATILVDMNVHENSFAIWHWLVRR